MNITGGKYNSRKVNAPESDNVRPTLSKIRAGVFNSLASQINFEEKIFLDLFSGSGIMSLEALSRGFKKVISVEKDLKTSKIIKDNYAMLGLRPNLIVKDAIAFLNSTNDKFDVIYIDPPYKNIELYNNSLKIIEKNNLLNDEGVIVIESQKGNENYIIPDGLKFIKEKLYGDTIIRFYKK